jgi:hypothetical protein
LNVETCAAEFEDTQNENELVDTLAKLSDRWRRQSLAHVELSALIDSIGAQQMLPGGSLFALLLPRYSSPPHVLSCCS